jgi:hypothetical protein
VTPSWANRKFKEGYAVWIDFNADGDFDDAGEQVMTIGATSSSPVSGTVSIPTSATIGATRMRVSMKYNGIPSLVKLSLMEVEDYTVIIDGAAFNAVNSTSANDNSGFDLLYIRTRHLTLLIFLQTNIKKVLIKFIIPKDLKFKTEILR